jgi:hypothetical protein
MTEALNRGWENRDSRSPALLQLERSGPSRSKLILSGFKRRSTAIRSMAVQTPVEHKVLSAWARRRASSPPP